MAVLSIVSLRNLCTVFTVFLMEAALVLNMENKITHGKHQPSESIHNCAMNHTNQVSLENKNHEKTSLSWASLLNHFAITFCHHTTFGVSQAPSSNGCKCSCLWIQAVPASHMMSPPLQSLAVRRSHVYILGTMHSLWKAFFLEGVIWWIILNKGHEKYKHIMVALFADAGKPARARGSAM